MAEIGGKHRQQSLHILPLPVPRGQVMDREAVPEIMQARNPSPTCRALDTGNTTQVVEGLLNGAAGKRRSSPIREEEGVRALRKQAASAQGHMSVQHLRKLW